MQLYPSAALDLSPAIEVMPQVCNFPHFSHACQHWYRNGHVCAIFRFCFSRLLEQPLIMCTAALTGDIACVINRDKWLWPASRSATKLHRPSFRHILEQFHFLKIITYSAIIFFVPCPLIFDFGFASGNRTHPSFMLRARSTWYSHCVSIRRGEYMIFHFGCFHLPL